MAVKEHGNPMKDSIINIKNYFITLPRKRKIFLGVLAAIIVLIAVILTLILNGGKPEYRVLYSGLDAADATELYTRLQEMGVQPQLDGGGNILVRAADYDKSLLQLVSEGLPQSGLAYDILDSHSGLTTTEAQLDQYKLYQLQNRIQDTLKIMDGVQGAAVTITPAKESDYIWQQATDPAKATASVLLSLRKGVELTSQQVQTIKNLVAASIYKLDAADVSVVDAATSTELFGADEGTSGYSAGKNLELEQMVQRLIEDNIVRLLTPTYGREGVVAVAKVTLDFDAMMTEKYDMSGVPDKDGNPTNDGYVRESSQAGAVNGEVPLAQGVAGEENNTDIPGYAYRQPNSEGGGTGFSRNVIIDYNYIKTQIEKGNAVIDRATIAVMVDDPSMTEARRLELVDNISKGADIPPELISVGTFRAPTAPGEPGPQQPEPDGGEDVGALLALPWWGWAIFAGVVLIAAVVLAVVLIRRYKRRREAERLAAEMEEAALEAAGLAAEQTAVESPEAESDVFSEVRNFAKLNPEITADLLRSWLKEADES